MKAEDVIYAGQRIDAVLSQQMAVNGDQFTIKYDLFIRIWVEAGIRLERLRISAPLRDSRCGNKVNSLFDMAYFLVLN